MSGFTAEDFAQAHLATRGEGEVALRVDSEVWFPWRVRFGADSGSWRSDEGMAAEGWVLAVEAPITLDGLAAAWGAAERADECREGDVLIIRDDEDNYLVRRMCDRSRLDSTARILSRAPKRAPWADLADIIGRYDGYTGNPAGLAQFLHENEVTTPFDHDGVRVTGGEEA